MADANLPIWHSIRVGYADTFRNLDKVLKLAWVPALLAFSASYLVDVAYHVTRPDGTLDGPYFGVWTEPIAYARMVVIDCCLAVFALAIFRYRLLGWSDATNHVRLRVAKRELTFVGAGVLATAIHIGLWSYFVAARVLGSLEGYAVYAGIELFSMAVYFTYLFVFARLCFALAAGSLIPEIDVREIWRIDLRDWGALVVILAATIGPLTILNSIPRYLSYFSLSVDGDSFLVAARLIGMDTAALLYEFLPLIVSLTVLFFGIAIAVTAVSTAYRVRTARRQPLGV